MIAKHKIILTSVLIALFLVSIIPVPAVEGTGVDLTVTVVTYLAEVPANTPTTINAKEEAGVVLEDFTSTESATVTISLHKENPHPEAEVPNDSPLALGIYLEMEATVTEFTTKIKVYYTDDAVSAAGIDEATLRLYYFNGSRWVICEKTGVDTVENYIWAQVTHFTIFAAFGSAPWVEPPPTPAEFKFSDLAISPKEVSEGEEVKVTLKATNIGEEKGTYTVQLKVDGAVKQLTEVTLDGGASTTVTFTLVEAVGEHVVDVEGLTGTFTVLPAPISIGYILVFIVLFGIVVALVFQRWRLARAKG